MLEEEKKQTKEKEDIDIPRLLTAQEVGEMLGISERAVNRLVREGRLGYVRLTGNRRLFTTELVGEFIRAETVRRSPEKNVDHVRQISYRPAANPYDCRDANYYGHIPRNYPDGWSGPGF
jgi:excisionase family DNA binding protein